MNKVKKKYKLLKTESIEVSESTLYRIKALRDFGNVKKGDIGGYIEKEDNLSHEGSCWVHNNAVVLDDAKVFGDATVCGNAKISGSAKVCDNAKVSGNTKVYEMARICCNAEVHGRVDIHGNSIIYDNARVCNNAMVAGYAKVCGNAYVHDNAAIWDNAAISDKANIHNAHVYGNAKVCENAEVCGDAKVYGDALLYGYITVCGNATITGYANMNYEIEIGNCCITSEDDYYYIDKIGSRNSDTIFFKNKKGKISVICGCFHGSLKKFKKKVKETHGDNKYAKEYLLAIKIAELKLLERCDDEVCKQEN